MICVNFVLAIERVQWYIDQILSGNHDGIETHVLSDKVVLNRCRAFQSLRVALFRCLWLCWILLGVR